MCLCTCLFLLGLFLFKTANVSSLFKVQVILIPVTENLDVHKLRGILRRTSTQSVKTQRIFIVISAVIIILAASIKLAVNKLPVIFFLTLVIVNRTTTSEVFHLNRIVIVLCNDYLVAMTVTSLVYRV